ncbi:MAG: cytochrome-c peroxidase [Deltaproteobacteria bacterium]|nr:MAG: cytochrome-c peroxidase [Deltaproteobacteria bacterium]
MKYLLILSLLFSCTKKPTKEDKELLTEALEYFKPLPDSLIDVNDPVNEAKIFLGKKLYLEKGLSINGQISCNSCHLLDKFGVDGEKTSPGHDGRRGDRNSPTVYNAGLHLAQFWDGRAKDLEEQALGPILNPIEMGMKSEAHVVLLLKSDAEYIRRFNDAFPKEKDPIVYKNVGVAIGAFEKTLLTPSRFDEYLKGDYFALDAREKKGLKTFIEVGCITCHEGAGIGGGQYQKLGLVEEYKTEDKGRFVVTGDEEDMHVFKVPSLRNITKTGPYFHDGHLDSLDDVIKIMAKHQLGAEVSAEQVADIKAFLESLTGELPKF